MSQAHARRSMAMRALSGVHDVFGALEAASSVASRGGPTRNLRSREPACVAVRALVVPRHGHARAGGPGLGSAGQPRQAGLGLAAGIVPGRARAAGRFRDRGVSGAWSRWCASGRPAAWKPSRPFEQCSRDGSAVGVGLRRWLEVWFGCAAVARVGRTGPGDLRRVRAHLDGCLGFGTAS